MQEWKKQEQIAGVENAGVNRMEPTRDYIEKTSSYFVGLILILLTE